MGDFHLSSGILPLRSLCMSGAGMIVSVELAVGSVRVARLLVDRVTSIRRIVLPVAICINAN